MRNAAQFLPVALGALDLASLDALADYHAAVAQEFRAAADRKRGDIKRHRKTAGRLERLATIPAVFANYAAAMSQDAALRATMQSLGVPEETVHAWLKAQRREDATQARRRNKAQALEMMHQGLSNGVIAQRLRISTASVSRLLRGERRSPAPKPRAPMDLETCFAADAAFARGDLDTYLPLKRAAMA